MLEWLKRHAWKACILQKGIRGSNPRLSAKLTGQNRKTNSQVPQIQFLWDFFYLFISALSDDYTIFEDEKGISARIVGNWHK